MLIPLMVALLVDSPVPVETREEAAILWMLCLMPAWFYLGTRPGVRRPIPFLPIIGALYGLYYALPAALGAFNQHYKITVSPGIDYNEAVFAALLGWLMLGVGYGAAMLLLPNNRSIAVQSSEKSWQFYGVSLMVLGLGLDVAQHLHPIPIEIAGVLRFVSMLGWFGSGLLVTLSTRGRLSPILRFVTYIGVAGFVLVAIAGGLISSVAFYGVVILTAVWIGRGRLSFGWITGAVVSVVLLISLRGVTDDYRRIVWYKDEGGSQLDNAHLFLGLLDRSIQADGISGAISHGFEKSEARSANLDILADVIRRTPGEVRYWGGETYLSLVGSFVPRFLWPDKPTKELGQAFGHRYSYLDARDSRTSLNFPILVEFFANFGLLGVVFGMGVVGVVYRLVERAVNNPGQDEILSLAGIVLMIPLTNIESDLSLAFGGLILNGIAFWLVLRMMRQRAPIIPSHESNAVPYVHSLLVEPHGS
jgi:hypothetical protein